MGAESIVVTDELRESEAIQEWRLSSGLSMNRKVIPFIDTEKMGVEVSLLDM